MFSDLPLPSLLALIGVLLFSLSWHEAAHAWMADRCGDTTARELGRVTLNPLKHLDPFLSVILPGLMIAFGVPPIGGGKPVPVNVQRLRNPSRDFMFVAVAGPLSNLLLAALFGLIFVGCIWQGVFVTWIENPFDPGHPTPHVPSILGGDGADNPWFFALQMGLLMNISLAFFNLLPIPPLDGSRIIGWLLPGPFKMAWYRLDRFALFIILGLYLALHFTGLGDYIGDHIIHAWLSAADTIDRLAWRMVTT